MHGALADPELRCNGIHAQPLRGKRLDLRALCSGGRFPTLVAALALAIPSRWLVLHAAAFDLLQTSGPLPVERPA